MNILISVNQKYLDKAESMLLSLRLHTPGEIRVFLMAHSLNEKEIDRFRRFLTRHDMALELVDVHHTELDAFPLGNRHFSIEMYYRILAQFLLPADLERILWMDADIIIRKDLTEFYNQDFNRKLLCVCRDKSQESPEVVSIKERLGLGQEHVYFNSGVLLLNLARLRQATTRTNILKVAAALSDRLTYPDQDILNFLYTNEVKYCPWEVYNYQVLYERRIPKDRLAKIAILHYVGECKPWNYHYLWPSARDYWAVQCRRGRIVQTVGMYLTYWAWAASFFVRQKLGLVKE